MLRKTLIVFFIFLVFFAVVRVFSIFDSFDIMLYWLYLLLSFIVLSTVFLLVKKGVLRSSLFFISTLAVSLLLLKSPDILGYSVSYKESSIEDNSNLPTVQQGDFVVSKHFGFEVQPGNMYGIEVNNVWYRKRLHGMPGDKVHICNEKVYINGVRRSAESQWKEQLINDFSQCNKINQVFILKADSYYFLGDNPYKIYDSRHFGVVTTKQIIAKSLYVIRDDDSVSSLDVDFQ